MTVTSQIREEGSHRSPLTIKASSPSVIPCTMGIGNPPTPDLYFTSLTCTQEHRHGGNYPLMNAGKAVIRGGVLVMPIAMTIHHGFIDGHHLSLFYKKVEEFLK